MNQKNVAMKWNGYMKVSIIFEFYVDQFAAVNIEK